VLLDIPDFAVFCRGAWELSLGIQRRPGGEEAELSLEEFDVLRHLVTHAGKVLTHHHLFRKVWGPVPALFICGSRQRPEPQPSTHILSELGVEYRLQLSS
jgi:two-component system KDP operon response regulator KdpE